MLSLEDIKWVYSEVQSQMFYNGKTLEDAIEHVFSQFDGTQPAELKDAVIKYAEYVQSL